MLLTYSYSASVPCSPKSDDLQSNSEIQKLCFEKNIFPSLLSKRQTAKVLLICILPGRQGTGKAKDKSFCKPIYRLKALWCFMWSVEIGSHWRSRVTKIVSSCSQGGVFLPFSTSGLGRVILLRQQWWYLTLTSWLPICIFLSTDKHGYFWGTFTTRLEDVHLSKFSQNTNKHFALIKTLKIKLLLIMLFLCQFKGRRERGQFSNFLFMLSSM